MSCIASIGHGISRFFFVLAAFSLLLSCSLKSGDLLVKPDASEIEQYKTLYVGIFTSQQFHNPYNPDDIQMDALITDPDLKTWGVPCFYLKGESGNSIWQARVTPKKAGVYTYKIRSVSSEGTRESPTFTLDVKASALNGFLTLQGDNDFTLKFDSGEPFRGLGLNVGWEFEPKWGGERTHTYEDYFSVLNKNGANFIRMWMCPWNLPLEWTRVYTYPFTIDEFQNWKKIHKHSHNLKLVHGDTKFSEDDIDRVIMTSDEKANLIYKMENIKKFKVKLFYRNALSEGDIRFYTSPDGKVYTPSETEFSETWDTSDNWHRLFIGSLRELPDGTQYLKIELMNNRSTPNLAGIKISHGKPELTVDADGIGRYSRLTAERLDEILDAANRLGIYIMLVHDYHGIFKPRLDRWGSNDEWKRNPYNTENGGPCDIQKEFFTDPVAKKFYKHRLRYMVARWGYSPNLAAWEFWNEIDNVINRFDLDPKIVAEWHREMAAYIREIDPFDHLVTTSVSWKFLPEIWHVRELDFSQHHIYGPTSSMKQTVHRYEEAFDKPCVIGEYAIGWRGPGKDVPVSKYEGEFHRGIWRGMFLPTPVLPMSWWWDWHIEQGHFFHFQGASRFLNLMKKKTGFQLRELDISADLKDLETEGVQSGERLFIWLANNRADTVDIVHVHLTEEQDGEYWIRIFDTGSGVFVSEDSGSVKNGRLVLEHLTLPPDGDIAVFCEKVK